MTTIARRALTKKPNEKNVNLKFDLKPIHAEGTFLYVPLSQIDISPLNYRRIFDEKVLQDFAKELAQHGVISPLTLRKKPSGRFELVAGERRLRAAKIAKLQSVPAMIKMLSDEHVIEIMLAENLQRENPHPLHEAQGIARMQKSGKSIEEISARLGKSKTFIYSRLKWAELILELQEMFLADKLTIQDATDLSILETESQREFFNQYCKDWEKKHFNFSSLRYAISRFKYDLKQAPFDIKDKTLVPEAGACSTCAFNSATRKTLFPELGKEATCSHKVCYKRKCISHIERSIRTAIEQHKPEALISFGKYGEETQMVIDSLPEVNALNEHSVYDISIFQSPTIPEKEHHTRYDEEGEEELDEQSYNNAVEEYDADLCEYETMIETGKLLKGLCIRNDQVSILHFNLEKKSGAGNKVTAKEVQEAIKDGSATPELLKLEMDRILAREQRAKELDAVKVQKQIHEQYCQKLYDNQLKPGLSTAELVTARLIVYQSLDWSIKSKADHLLFEGVDRQNPEEFYLAISNLTEQQFASLIRLAITAKSESKFPGNITALSFYKMAKATGFNPGAIEKEQQQQAKARDKKVKIRIKDLEIKIKNLKP